MDYSLALSVMRNATDAEIDDVFGRINTYGHRLSDQERRQAGVKTPFSELVRTLSSSLRGDTSRDLLKLSEMPSISIDLPKTKHGYEVKAEDVFWVNHGILRTTDLRDSMDEQSIADIAACIISGSPIERSKDALDQYYGDDSGESEQLRTALDVYGGEKFADEFKFCVDEILKVCDTDPKIKLRNLIFESGNTNGFPTVFSAILIAFHEMIVGGRQKIASYESVRQALRNASNRLQTGRSATSSGERRRNIDAVKGLIATSFVDGDQRAEIYANHTYFDVDETIRRSELELSTYELKQGMLRLDNNRAKDEAAIEGVVATIAAIANNGPQSSGKILIGVANKEQDAARVEQLDHVTPRYVGRRFVVGVNREAVRLGLTPEQYFTIWRDSIKNAALSEPLKSMVLSALDYSSFFGLGVIIITVPPQTDVSYFNNQVYWRSGDETVLASSPQEIASIGKRF